MKPTLVVLALWSAYVTAVHVFGGRTRVLRPFREATVEPFARATMLVVWHIATWGLAMLTGTLALAAFVPGLEGVVAFTGVQVFGFAAVFIVTSRRELGAAIRLPQWLLLGPLACGLLATTFAQPGAITAGILLAALGVGHVLAWCRPSEPRPFSIYNRLMYSPGCLLIAALTATALT